jgi:hypothetical protein
MDDAHAGTAAMTIPPKKMHITAAIDAAKPALRFIAPPPSRVDPMHLLARIPRPRSA